MTAAFCNFPKSNFQLRGLKLWLVWNKHIWFWKELSQTALLLFLDVIAQTWAPHPCIPNFATWFKSEFWICPFLCLLQKKEKKIAPQRTRKGILSVKCEHSQCLHISAIDPRDTLLCFFIIWIRRLTLYRPWQCRDTEEEKEEEAGQTDIFSVMSRVEPEPDLDQTHCS